MTGATPGPHGCGRCPARWGGFKTCHCSACHETFSTARNFDAHQTVNGCRNPEESGLKIGSRGIWVQEGDFEPEILRADPAIGVFEAGQDAA